MSRLKLSQLSAFARAEEHLQKKTAEGGIITVFGILLALTLFYHETVHFWRLHTTTKMSVDMELRHDLPINLDISFPALPCAALSVQILDVSGTAESDTSAAKEMDLHKTRLDSKGRSTGRREYVTPRSESLVETGLMGEVMNVNIPMAMKHMNDLEAESQGNEGCRLSGRATVKRVAGRIIISTHKLLVFQLFPQLLGGRRAPVLQNMSHKVHHLSFGPAFPGLVNPLDKYDRLLGEELQVFKYFLKVVPTEHHSRSGHVTETHQYSVSEYALPLNLGVNPAVEINYDLSPIIMNIDANPPSLLHYLVRICAVIGGALALVRMLNQYAEVICQALGPVVWQKISAP